MTQTKNVKSGVIVVDDCDADLLGRSSLWSNGYIMWCGPMFKGIRERIPLHRLILGRKLNAEVPEDVIVDHIDGNPLNNSRNNLRECGRSNNSHNSKKSRDNTSGYKGVHWDNLKGGWRARIQAFNKRHELGVYATPEQARDAYIEAAKKYHGQFANDGYGPINLKDDTQ